MKKKQSSKYTAIHSSKKERKKKERKKDRKKERKKKKYAELTRLCSMWAPYAGPRAKYR